jgi:tetratricopeptide (TPR) repeat protein
MLSNDLRHTNQLASDWMHRGIDLLNDRSSTTLEQAVRCFDEAIALRLKLPLEEDHFLRYGLGAGWINRGDALARMGGDGFLAEAVRSYDEALLLLESLPLEENELYPRRLAITWINRGLARQKQQLSNDRWEALECFREALGVLGRPSAHGLADKGVLLAGAWINLAGALIGSVQEDAEDLRSAARQALVHVQDTEQTDIISAEIGLKARHLLCRMAVRDLVDDKILSDDAVAEATDAVDESMALVRRWKSQAPDGLRQLALGIFRFGCRIYESSQPHFLAEFLMECLSPELFGEAIPPDQETLDAARATIWSSLAKLQPEGFRFVATPEFATFLSEVRDLRKIEDRLRQLSPLSPAS